ncbi:hypothetical protein [Bradyrhizobium sp. ISRA463]|uniref:hypothetical protein n=1 Tax=Bradyrhizobium sp. ISRA463 TaxID=2866199 RepID=UPI00247A2D52|nr:hypothetical protein [Bradyrhizobium sp. ISRA463]WGS20178.1 ATP-binding protein [Bradyrhizobium sp. ISRA463]
MERLQLWWDLPGPASVINKVTHAVGDRDRVVCVSAPYPRPAGMCKAIQQKLRAELSLEGAILDVSRLDQTEPIPHLLAGLLGISAVEIGSISDFAAHPGLVDQALIVDGIDPAQIRRWSLFLRQLHSERASDAVIGPVVVVVLPNQLTSEAIAELRGPANLVSTLGCVDRYDTVSYVTGIGARPTSDLASRVGHAVAIDVAAWSRELLETMIAWETSDQLDPFALLERLADQVSFSYPCWENGLVDYWDDEPTAHAIAAVKHGLRDHIARRVWSAQASILLPFTYRILRSLISKYRDALAKKVSPETPLLKQYGDRAAEPVTDFWKLEFHDMMELTKEVMTPPEYELARIARWTRNAVCHRNVIAASRIQRFSEHYEANEHALDSDIPGWNWPRCGQMLTLTVGPSGAGKSAWSAEQGAAVVSSDAIRREKRPTARFRGIKPGCFIRCVQEAPACCKRDETSLWTRCTLSQSTD